MVVINGNQDNGDPMERLAELADFIPLAAMLDIRNRISDWRIADGKSDDNYIWQQVRYAENCARAWSDNDFRGVIPIKRIIGYLLMVLVGVVFFIGFVYAFGLAVASITWIIASILVAIILLAVWLIVS